MQDGHQYESDIHVLAWPSVWMIAATGLIVAMINGQSLSGLNESGYALLGAATGCLISAWTLMGTWIGLAARPWLLADGSHRFATHLAMAAPGLVTALVLISAVWLRHDTSTRLLITHLVLTATISLIGPLIVWQWTRRRIHRGETRSRHPQSIRQILGVVLTIALAIGAIRMSQRWLGITVAETAVIMPIAFNWVLMLGVLLGKRPWFVLLLIGFLIAEWITISTMVELQTQKDDRELTFIGAMLHCSFGFSLLFLIQMRASGYRWLHDKMQAQPKTTH